MPLLYLLSDDLALRGPKFGCGLAQCGACTVIVNGEGDSRSCVTPVGTVDGAGIMTLEGLGSDREAPPDPAGVHRRAGVAVRVLPQRRDSYGQGVSRSRTRDATDAQIREALANVLCRCGVNVRMLRAIRRYADRKGDGMSGATRRIARRIADARRAARAEPCGPVPAELPQAVGRADCGLRRDRRNRCSGVRAGAGDERAGQRPARLMDCRRCRRPGDGLHGQVRARAGPLHRADAARRRGARRAARSRDADPVRHRRRRRIRGRRPARSRIRPTSIAPTSRWRPRRRAKRWCGWRRRASAVPSRSSGGRAERRRSPTGPIERERVSYGELVGGEDVRPAARLESHAHGIPRDWTVLGTPVAAPRPSRDGDRASSSSCTTFASRHAARRGRPAADAWARRCVGVDEALGARHAGLSSAWSSEEQLRRGGRRRSRGRRCRRRRSCALDWSEGHDACRHSASCTSTCGAAPHAATRCSSIPATSTNGSQSAARVVKATYHYPYQMHGSLGTSCAVADVRGRQGDDLVGDAGGLPAALHRPRCCWACRPSDVRVDLPDGLGLLRPQRRRHGELRRGAPLAGRRAARARAALARRRDGVGELRHGVCHRSARRARR